MTPNAIPKRQVGRTELQITELGFGAASLGNLYHPVSDDDATATLQAALKGEFGYIDTAPRYGFGLSERRVGNVLRQNPGAVLSSKVGRLLRPDPGIKDDSEREGFRSPMPFREVFDYSYDAIMRSFEDSLQRLGLAHIDILYIHDIGRLTHGDNDGFHFDALTKGGGLRALESLREAGAINAFGVGVNEIEICQRVMDHATLDVILLAGRYTLLEQGALDTLFPRCAKDGTSIVIGGAYNSGILATGVKGPGPHYYDYGAAPTDIVSRVAAIERHCDRYDIALAAAALRFPLAHPIVASVIPGLGNKKRVQQTLDLYRTYIPNEFWQELRAEGLIVGSAPVPGATS